MKILHVITSLRTGGAEKLMVDLLPRLKDTGHEVALCLFDGIRTPFYDEIVAKGIKVYDFGAGNSVYSLRNIFRLRRLMRDYDIVHTHNTSPQFFAALANIGLGKRLVTTEHNTYNRRRDIPGFRLLDKIMYECYSSIICISDSTHENLKNFLGKLPTIPMETIYNGVDVSRFANAVSSSDLDSYKVNGTKIILMVAAFREQKDQPTVIRALRMLPDNFHLFLVGDGPKRKDCEALSSQMELTDRVHFMGVRSDVPELLKACDCEVLSSHWEGFGLAALEGLAAGKPVVASNVEGLRDVVSDYGSLFTPEDDRDLADKIEYQISNTTSLLNEQRIQYAYKYDISHMLQKYLNVYCSIIGNNA